MKNIRSLFVFIFVGAAALTAFAGLRMNLDTPVDVGSYVAGGGMAASIDLVSRDYETGEVRFRLLDNDGNPLGNGAVFGITLPEPDRDANLATVKTRILAAIPAAPGG